MSARLLNEISNLLGGGCSANILGESELILRAAISKGYETHEEAARAMARRRAQGVPLAYVTGHETFMGIDMLVDEGALIPRRETELLGYAAIDALRACESSEPTVIDMCCGSGNLACAIATHWPIAHVWASDLTDGCVNVARRNVEHTGLSGRVKVNQGDLFQAIEGCGLEEAVDVIVCNPPYISQGKLSAEKADLLNFEPREAFDGGPYGLSIHQRVIRECLPFLKPGGVLLFEIGHGQEKQVRMLFERAKTFCDIQAISNSDGDVLAMSGKKM